MSEGEGGSITWAQELASLVEDTGVRYTEEIIDYVERERVDLSHYSQGFEGDIDEVESFKDQIKGFVKASGEMLHVTGIGIRDIMQQTIVHENSFIVRRFGGAWARVSGRLRFLNDFLPEDRDPVHAWPVIFSVLILALADEWWRNFGIDDLELQTLTIRILSQTCSSSGCERNWSVFERIHTKRRNRLEHKRLNDLVYTHYNLHLKERQASRKSLTDPISLENIDLTDDWVVEAEDDDAPLLDVDEIDDWMDVADAILDEGEGGAAAGEQLENTKDLTPLYFHHHIFALSALYDPLLNWFQTHPSPPIAILSDFFLGWTQNLANHLQIPRIAFYPSGAFVISVSQSLWPNLPQLDPNLPDPLQFPVSLPQIPNSLTLPYYQTPSFFRHYKKSDPTWEFIRDTMIANISSWGSVFNSFYDIEAPYLDHISKRNGNLRVWAVGPLLPPEIFKQKVEHTIERGGSSSMEALEWLDLQENSSVVYFCFGSQAILSKRQMKALRWALKSSGVGFVWCVKEGELGELPTGFEERTKSRGLVIRGWAPQVLILKHLSVGAFLTHCGWNSTLEGLVYGVPLLAWPMTADQFVNARLIVEELGVGIWACDGVEGVPDREELCKALVKILRENEEGKKRVLETQRLGLNVVSEAGTSSNDLDKFVKEIYSLDLANGGKE